MKKNKKIIGGMKRFKEALVPKVGPINIQILFSVLVYPIECGAGGDNIFETHNTGKYAPPHFLFEKISHYGKG